MNRSDIRLAARRCAYEWTSRFAGCLRASRKTCNVSAMMDVRGKLVVVPADQLDDLLELARLAAERLPDDQLARSLRSATATVRCSQLIEP